MVVAMSVTVDFGLAMSPLPMRFFSRPLIDPDITGSIAPGSAQFSFSQAGGTQPSFFQAEGAQSYFSPTDLH